MIRVVGIRFARKVIPVFVALPCCSLNIANWLQIFKCKTPNEI